MTGHELISALQAHPEWLGLKVILLADDFDRVETAPEIAVDYDQFDDDGPEALVLTMFST